MKRIIEIDESDYELSCQRYGDARYNGHQPGYENTAIAQSTPYNPSEDSAFKEEVIRMVNMGVYPEAIVEWVRESEAENEQTY